MTLVKGINEKVYKIIGSCMEIHKVLGPGHPVDLYRRALEVELLLKGLSFEAKKSVQVIYKDVMVGTVDIDFLIDNEVILEVRSEETLKDTEVQQILRYLSLFGSSVGVLVNFGGLKVQYKRILPSRQQKDVRKNHYHLADYREIGKTREGNPII